MYDVFVSESLLKFTLFFYTGKEQKVNRMGRLYKTYGSLYETEATNQYYWI